MKNLEELDVYADLIDFRVTKPPMTGLRSIFLFGASNDRVIERIQMDDNGLFTRWALERNHFVISSNRVACQCDVEAWMKDIKEYRKGLGRNTAYFQYRCNHSCRGKFTSLREWRLFVF